MTRAKTNALDRSKVAKEVRAFLDKRRPPERLRDKLDYGFHFHNRSVELYEIRPRYNDHSKKTELAFAKATYVKSRGIVQEFEISQTEISFALERCLNSSLMDYSKKRVLRQPLLEFITHGLKYVFPAQPGPICRGIPTSHSTTPLSKCIVSSENNQYVWPHGDGKVRGQAIMPIYPTAPDAALKDPQLHEMLALVDALRVGRARERKIGREELELRIMGPPQAGE
ncbi:MAG: hypothetical protein ABIJ96_07685 [Elusimicrobiota bacterium]